MLDCRPRGVLEKKWCAIPGLTMKTRKKKFPMLLSKNVSLIRKKGVVVRGNGMAELLTL